MATATTITPRLRALYDETLKAQLQETLGLGNIMEVPKLEKIVISMGVGAAEKPAKLKKGSMSRIGREDFPITANPSGISKAATTTVEPALGPGTAATAVTEFCGMPCATWETPAL